VNHKYKTVQLRLVAYDDLPCVLKFHGRMGALKVTEDHVSYFFEIFKSSVADAETEFSKKYD